MEYLCGNKLKGSQLNGLKKPSNKVAGSGKLDFSHLTYRVRIGWGGGVEKAIHSLAISTTKTSCTVAVIMVLKPYPADHDYCRF